MHGYYPAYRDELETTEPVTDLLVAVSLLRQDDRTYLILNNGPIRHPGRSPYIIRDTFYRRSGEYAGSELFRVAEDLVTPLTQLSVGYPYMGGCDESIRRIHPNNDRWFQEQCKNQAAALRHHLIPGVHGWSSLYEYDHLAYWPIWCVSTDGGWARAFIPVGVQFSNPLDEVWVVRFDGAVCTGTEFETQAEAESERIFEQFHPQEVSV